ncbi:MAG: protease complex subunit PrcB family protein [Candidatus Aureabacteria bacterium]|nr:protease complex subunit PrcB family protein [Candidatus Auribacterota bacterium]
MRRAIVVAALIGIGAANGGNLPLHLLRSGTDAAYGIKNTKAVPEVVVARDEGELRRIWAEDMSGSYGETAGLPRVDWKAEFVVAVFIGMRPSAGYTIEITRIRQEGNVLEVTVAEARPPAGVMSADLITSPYCIAACPRDGAAPEKVLTLKLLDAEGKTLVERAAWAYRSVDAPQKTEAAEGR